MSICLGITLVSVDQPVLIPYEGEGTGFKLPDQSSLTTAGKGDPGTLLSQDKDSGSTFKAPAFPIRGWESQLEGFWCQWMGGTPEWFKNGQYLAYLRDAFSRAPLYHINTFMLMGRGSVGELHTFVNYTGWDKLSALQSKQEQENALEQAKVVEDLSKEARKYGMGLFLWDHELQLPRNFADLYPEAKGVGNSFCPSSPLVWKLLADKYEEFFKKVPSLAGIVLVFAETQFNMLEGSLCKCDLCKGKTGAYFVERIIRTASKACVQHSRQLFVRNFGHGYDEIETILNAILAIDSDVPFISMSKMVPYDFFSLQLPPDPATTKLIGRPRIMEDGVGGEFRGKTHIIVLPDDYYAKHLRYALANGGTGAVFRLDQMAFPRSVFEMPNEFNVWLTSQLMLDPDQDLDDLWLEWTSKRYGPKAAPFVIKALKRTDDIWEHSTNSFGFYATAAHGEIAPFFRGPYNAFLNLWEVGDLQARTSPEMARKFQELLNPDRATLDEVVKEREQAVQWSVESLSDLQKAKPYLTKEANGELNYYLELQVSAARIWCELGDLFFTGLAILKAEGFPKDLVERLYNSSDRALHQGYEHVKQFGRSWPLIPDANTISIRPSLELAMAGLWGELLDRMLNIKPVQPYPWETKDLLILWSDKKRIPRSDAERLYLAILEASSDLGTQVIAMEGGQGIAKMQFKGTSLIVEGSNGQRLSLPAGVAIHGAEMKGTIPCKVQIRKTDSGLLVEVL